MKPDAAADLPEPPGIASRRSTGQGSLSAMQRMIEIREATELQEPAQPLPEPQQGAAASPG